MPRNEVTMLRVNPTLMIAARQAQRPGERLVVVSSDTVRLVPAQAAADGFTDWAYDRVALRRSADDPVVVVAAATETGHACPDCGKTFPKPNGVGPHRRMAHGYRVP